MISFIYHWYVDDEFNKEGEKELAIRAYGITKDQKTIILHIKNFQPWIYLEIKKDGDTSNDWDQIKSLLKNKIRDRCKHLEKSTFYLEHRKKLYFDDQIEYPFFKIRFNTIQVRKNVYYSLQNYTIRLLGKQYTVACHEHEATPLLQLIVSKSLPTAGWIHFKGSPVPEEERVSKLYDEFVVSYDDLKRASIEEEVSLGVPVPCVLSFDIEVYSSNPQRMPLAEVEQDKIFQISCVLEKFPSITEKYLLTLGKVSSTIVGSDVQNIQCKDEKMLLLSFTKLIRQTNPHMIVGYNIFGFDIPYMIKRCKLYDILSDFDLLGIPNFKHAPEKEIKWSSSAYSYQEFHYLDTEGRVFVDLLPVVKRDYKFSNYKLKTVSTFFLGETKDPLTPQDIFKAYELGCLGDANGIKKLSQCGKYCVQDSALVLKLFGVLQLWIGLSEMAKICNVPMMFLFTKGQQIKVFSQVYKKCFDDHILVQSIQDHELLQKCQGYSGAFVFPPEPGIYDWVIPFDFSSLYPTTIIAYNIDYSTLVLDESKVNINDCHLVEWEDHINCEHDTTVKKAGSSKSRVLCGKHRYLFRKEPLGVIPSLLMNLLNQRSETKKQMKSVKKICTDKEVAETRLTVLDKRQLAYKLSANSMYGAMGVKKGYLPFMPGAMSTTAMGRASIQKAAEFVKKKYDGHLIYGDSVAKDTPLAICESNTVRVVSIEDLFNTFEKDKKDYPEFKPNSTGLSNKERIEPLTNIKVMSKSGWSQIRKVIRHHTNKNMFRVMTTSGIVDVTEDHSLLDKLGKQVKPGEINVGDELLYWNSNEFWESTRLELSLDITDTIEILSNGTVVFYFNDSKTSIKNDIMMLYLYLSQKFPKTCIEYYPDKVLFYPNQQEYLGKILEIQDLGPCEDFVYDIETEDGTFHAGIGNLIVKNTDSIYCHFPGYTDAKKSWQMAKKVEDQLLKLFPPPMKLVFEEKIYSKFLILTKKRYMAYTCGENGEMDEKLTIRGVLLARRDNCKWIRVLYEKVVRALMNADSQHSVYELINGVVLDLMYWKLNQKGYFVISKQVNKEYKVRPLPTESKKMFKRLEDLGIYDYPKDLKPTEIDHLNSNITNEQVLKKLGMVWFEKYILRSKPAHVQLASKMTLRGKPVEAGSRIEFLVIQNIDTKAKLCDRLEDPVYYKSHRDLLRLDRLYYLGCLSEPLDQLLNVVYRNKNFVSKIHDYHVNMFKVMEEIKRLNSPIILLGDEVYKPPIKRKTKKKTKIEPIPENKSVYDYI